MDKKRKRVAPLKKATSTCNFLQESTAEVTDGLLDNAFGEIFATENNEKAEDHEGEEIKYIDLDDWKSPTTFDHRTTDGKFTHSSKLSLHSAGQTITKDARLPINDRYGGKLVASCKDQDKNSVLGAVNVGTSKTNVPLNDRFGGKIMFSSRETEKDSVLGLVFSKRTIPASTVKDLTANLEFVSIASNLKNSGKRDFFTCGVVTEYTILRKSGSAVTLTDLAIEPCFIRVLLFGAASSAHNSITNGNIIILLSPKKGQPYNGKEALIVNDEKQLVIAGVSRDYGVCGARKKAGGTCKNVVNLNLCRYCSYHALSQFKQKQVGKNIRSVATGNGLLPEHVKSVTVNSMQWMGQPNNQRTLIPARRNGIQIEKDRDTLARLNSSQKKSLSSSKSITNTSNEVPSLIPTSALKRKLLDTLDSPVPSNPSAENKPGSNSVGDIGFSGFFDYLKLPNEKQKTSSAKRRALEFVKQAGGITPPEKKPIKVIVPASDVEDKTEEKTLGITDEFLSLMKEQPSNPALLREAESEERDKRFDRLKVIEEIGEKLSNTHEVPVRAIRCLVCQKNFFQLPIQCAKSSHKCRVVQATKRFFQCGSCKNRTSTLEKLPLTECNKCGKWVWQRAGVAAEKICSTAQKLSVRGLEEKFLGSVVTDANLSLLVPDDL